MEQITDFNFTTPLPPIGIVNILNDQVNYVEDNINNAGTDHVLIDVINTQSAPEEPPRLMRSYNFTQGEFLYIKNIWEREMLQNGWAAVEQLNLWDFMKKDCDSYMMSNAPEIMLITKKMEELGYNGHSGASFACTMRTLQYIAKNGEIAYKNSRIPSE